MLIFVFRMVVSSLFSLLVVGYGNAASDIGSRHQALLAAISRLHKQIEAEKEALAKICDPVALDSWLAQKSRLFAIEAVEVIGFSASSEKVKEAGGGIIGSPYERLQAAQSQMEFITPDICIITYPGGPGVALIGVGCQAAEKFFAIVKQTDVSRRSVNHLLTLAEATAAKATLVILDGCGTGDPGGGFSIKHANSKKVYHLPGNGVSGAYSLELYIYPPASA